ncbi:MAG TPA: hypothetical protein VIX85_03090 [Acidimicrobiales bacterium]
MREPRGPRQQPTPAPVLFRTISSSLLVGAATGMRSQLGVAAVVLRADRDGLPPFLRTTAAARSVTVAAVAEFVVDKLPIAGDRLRPPSLALRFALGGLAAALLAHAERRPVVPAAALAVAAAGLGAKAGHDLRALAARTVPDPVVAVVEDGVAITLAAAATRPSRWPPAMTRLGRSVTAAVGRSAVAG